MQISAIKRLLRQISKRISREEIRPSAETSESETRAEVIDDSLLKEVENAIDEGEFEAEEIAEGADSQSDFDENTESLDDWDVTEENGFDTEREDSESESYEEDDGFDETSMENKDVSMEKASAETAKMQNLKEHLVSSVPRTARLPKGALTKGEIAEIRSILGNLDDAEIHRLYRRVTK